LLTPNSKRKLGNDPNNTKWSRNTDSFGQKILRAQGWQPGEYLGAKDAPHAEWHTEANSAHIRVVLKDDTLGLGAKRNNGDECTGLDAFQHLLGRLNGKSDEALETERKAREDLKLSLYVERKLGTIRFVKGGWLVGDQVKDTPDEEVVESPNESASETPNSSAGGVEAADPAPTKSKKRKADQDDDEKGDKKRKKEKKSKKRKAESDVEADGESAREKKDKKKSKKRNAEVEEGDGEASASSKSSKDRKDKENAMDDSAESTSNAVSEAGEPSGEADSAAEKRKAKKEEKDKKKDQSDKKERKEKKEKKRRKDGSASETTSSTPVESSISTPSGSGYSTPVPTGSSRYLARSRFIAQKKMAFADSAALNQVSLGFPAVIVRRFTNMGKIFMIKS
jgi:Pin2-interacting protein X1